MKTLYTLKSFAIGALGLLALPLTAQDMSEVNTNPLSTEPATEKVAEEKEEDVPSFILTGYVDAYFQNVFSDGEGGDDTPGTPLGFPTSFTPETRGFGVGNVNLLAEKSLGKVGFVGQVGFGPRANAANGDFPNLQQLYVTYSPSDAVTFTLGQFGTFVGYEVIDAPANMNYSTSYLFSYGPFFHTGLKADFAIAEGFGAMVGVFNNTDSRFNDPGYHYGAQLSAESGGLAAYLNFLYGTAEKDVNDNDDDVNEFQIDLTATYEVSETLMFGINVSDKTTSLDGNTISGNENGTSFTGAALYTTVGVTEGFDLSLRGEYFSVKEDELETNPADGRSVIGLTATGNITIGDLRIMPEVRFDTSSDFDTTNSGDIIGFGGGDNDDSIASFILAAVYSF